MNAFKKRRFYNVSEKNDSDKLSGGGQAFNYMRTALE